MNFDRAVDDLLGNEGRYSNNPVDPGGETCWGITVRVARGAGYFGEMRYMPKAVAKRIYGEMYWLAVFDKLPYAVSFQVFDASVNHGSGNAIRWLQRAVGVVDDGNLGPLTMKAIEAQDARVTVLLFNAERMDFYTRLSTWADFGKGWTERVAGNLRKGAVNV